MKMPGKDELGKFWVLSCVACYAQHLNICRIGSKAGFRTVRFDVVTLQIFLVSALLTLTALLHNLPDNFPAVVFAFACAAVPFGVRSTAHFFTPSNGHASDGAVLACSASAFSYLKLFPALFARTLHHSFWFAGFKFLRAVTRTGGCFPTNVGVWATKNLAASRTCKYSTSATFNFSPEFSHG